MSLERTAQGVLADLSATTSVGFAGYAWMAPVADALQIVATMIAIVAGLYAIRWHRIRIALAKEKRNAKSNRRPDGRASQPSGGKSSGGSETSKK